MTGGADLCRVPGMFQGRGICVALLFGSLSCAPPPKTAEAPPARESTVATEPKPDLSPVSAPDQLVAVGRVQKPRALIETVLGWAGMPIGLRNLLPPDWQGLENVLAWDAPLEVAAVLGSEQADALPPPRVVVSAGLSSLEGARSFVESHGGRAVRVAAGVYRVELHGAHCAIAAALGSSPARLVCGDDWKDVEPLLPYATRGLPRETLTDTDVFFEIRLRPIERRYRDQIRSLRVLAGLFLRQIETDDARLDRALSDVVYALADELGQIATEADRLTLAAKLDSAGRSIDLGYTLALQGSSSTFGEILREAAKRAAPPPAVFFRLPADAHSGGFGIAGDPARLSKLMNYVSELLDAYLAREKLGARFRQRVRAALEAIPGVYGKSAYVSGGTATSQGMPAKERLAASVGWHVGVVEQRIDGLTKLFGELVAAFNDREFANWLVEKRGIDRALMPKARSANLRVPSFAGMGSAYAIELPPKLASQIFDALPDEGTAPGGGKPPKPQAKAEKVAPVSISIVLVPDGGETWFALAASQRAAVEKLVLAHGDAGAKLDSRAGLAPLKATTTVSGGFTTVESFARMFSELAEKSGVDLTAGLAKVPEHGRTPILWWGLAEESGKELRVGARMRVPAGAVADVGGLIVQAAGR
jgi:hypothetical protein